MAAAAAELLPVGVAATAAPDCAPLALTEAAEKAAAASLEPLTETFPTPTTVPLTEPPALTEAPPRRKGPVTSLTFYTGVQTRSKTGDDQPVNVPRRRDIHLPANHAGA